ncbi:MAG: OmpA family protein [Phormidesmis sp. RL_2_1]|nr:OmpA family protein [Phormidesmis sp. RL_2_1]
MSLPAGAQITVNSSADGPVQPDLALTLREAIELTNGTLPWAALSAAEQQLVVATNSADTEIRFNLPVGETTIRLASLLPAIVQPGLTIDGTTQPGYDPNSSTSAEITVPVPVVVLRPAETVEVFRGLTLAASNITVRGLSVYGFNAPSQITQSTPPADIFISHRQIPLNRATPLPATDSAVEPALDMATDSAEGYGYRDEPPTGIVIEQNWIGIPPDEARPAVPSGFGVSVFDSAGTTIRQNRIEYHNGSAIITGRQADDLAVLNNIIVGNGISGMPDAIRLHGQVNNGLISDNLICGNDGSGVFIFRPSGNVTVANNHIRWNGQRLRRAAVYLIGDNHRVVNNDITHQKGGGVVVGQSVNTNSDGNVITGNRFGTMEGLSIDLIAREDRRPRDFDRGDGINPVRNSANRRQDTGNGAVNAPRFDSAEVFVINGTVQVGGEADPGSEVQLYRSTGRVHEYGPLSQPLGTTTADAQGRFGFVLDGLAVGEVLSAIATDPRYGTSEPARNISIRALTGVASMPNPMTEPVGLPQCITPPAPPTSPVAPVETPPVPETIELSVPRNIHFGLDQDFISAESAAVLDQIAEVLRQYPSVVVDLHGHTDSRASQTYNQDLARRRAENARYYLLDRGIGAERMTLRSLGETQLLVEETNRANYARNRRVEFILKTCAG